MPRVVNTLKCECFPADITNDRQSVVIIFGIGTFVGFQSGTPDDCKEYDMVFNGIIYWSLDET